MKKKGNAVSDKERENILQEEKFCYIYKEELNEELNEDKATVRFEVTGITQENILSAHIICNLSFKNPKKKNPVLFHNDFYQ